MSNKREVMNLKRKLVGFVSIALLGAFLGYSLGYAVYQPQIQNLQEELEYLTSNVEEWRLNHKWRRIYTAEFFEDFERISGKTVETEVFKVEGKILGTSLLGRILIYWDVQLPYTMVGPVAPIDIEFRLLQPNILYPDWTLNFTRGYPSNRLELSVPPGEYYLQIRIGKFNVLGQLQVAVYEYEY